MLLALQGLVVIVILSYLFMDFTSVRACPHGKQGGPKTPLPWDVASCGTCAPKGNKAHAFVAQNKGKIALDCHVDKGWALLGMAGDGVYFLLSMQSPVVLLTGEN